MKQPAMLVIMPDDLDLQTDEVVALVADMKASRRQADRVGLAERVEGVLGEVNRRFRPFLQAPLETTRGLDEVSAIIHGTCGGGGGRGGGESIAWAVAVLVNVGLWPVVMRFGVGRGVLDVGKQSTRAGEADGPAFHRAADALARCQEEDGTFRLNHGAFTEMPGPGVALIEAAADAHAALMAGWSPGVARVQQEAQLHLLKHVLWDRVWPEGDRPMPTQAEVAASLGVTQQAVSAAYRRGKGRLLEKIEAAVDRYLYESPPRPPRVPTEPRPFPQLILEDDHA